MAAARSRSPWRRGRRRGISEKGVRIPKGGETCQNPQEVEAQEALEFLYVETAPDGLSHSESQHHRLPQETPGRKTKIHEENLV